MIELDVFRHHYNLCKIWENGTRLYTYPSTVWKMNGKEMLQMLLLPLHYNFKESSKTPNSSCNWKKGNCAIFAVKKVIAQPFVPYS